jgi:hypothetical protein
VQLPVRMIPLVRVHKNAVLLTVVDHNVRIRNRRRLLQMLQFQLPLVQKQETVLKQFPLVAGLDYVQLPVRMIPLVRVHKNAVLLTVVDHNVRIRRLLQMLHHLQRLTLVVPQLLILVVHLVPWQLIV